MRLIVTIDSPDDLSRPGVPLAQTIRETATVIETMNLLIPGILTDRISGKTKASWLVGSPIVTAPVVTTYGPNPAPPNSEFGMSLTGNFFPTDAEVYFDGVPAPVTSVYSQWSITGTGPALPAGTHECMLVCSGLGYAHFDWTFEHVLPLPTLTSINPTTVPVAANATTPMTLILSGTNFTVNSVGIINGVAAVMQFFSATEIRASFYTPTVPGNVPVFVRTPDCPDTASINLVVTATGELSAEH